MMVLFEIRAKLTAIYQKYDFIFRFAVKFVLVLMGFMMIRNDFSANAALSKTVIVIGMAAFGSILPFSLTLLLMLAYLVLQILSASSLMAITVFIFCLIMYCFFLRFTPKQGAAVVAVPVLRSIGIPYAVPLTLGGFGDLFSIIPTCCGIFLYYMLAVVKDNLTITIDSLKGNTDAAFDIYMNVINQLIKNPAMYVTMLAYALCITVVYFVRRMKMDYSFEISIAVGTVILVIVNLIGGLKYDMGSTLVAVIFGALISGLITFVVQFFYRVLNYAATENVQFEDDDYYYYVKAVPKLRVSNAKKPVRKVVTLHARDEDDDEDELEDEVMDAVSDIVFREEKERSSTVVISEGADDGLFEDDDYEEEQDPLAQTKNGEKPAAAVTPAEPVVPSAKTTVTKDGKVLNVIFEDDEDEDE